MVKKIIIIIVLVVILILLGIGTFIWHNKYKEAVSFCEEDCVYYVGGWRQFSTKGDLMWFVAFDTEKDCVNVCLNSDYFLRAFKR